MLKEEAVAGRSHQGGSGEDTRRAKLPCASEVGRRREHLEKRLMKN
jgi:hypothetical protein